MSSATMEVCEQAPTFIEKDDDAVFDHMKYILRRGKEEKEAYFYAKLYERMPPGAAIDIETLDLIQIPAEHIWPPVAPSLTRAPVPLPVDCYVKRASLLDYDIDTCWGDIPKLVLEEAEVCEILRKNPHPNIAKYLGCKVVNDRIRGLCFNRYVMTLQDRVETGTPLDADLCLQGIKDGIIHLHGLGLTHNDINPRNIMLDADDKPVIIDFDSCRREGEELVKCGTPDWMIEDARYATRHNDFFGLSRLQEFLSGKSGVRYSVHEKGGDIHTAPTAEALDAGNKGQAVGHQGTSP